MIPFYVDDRMNVYQVYNMSVLQGCLSFLLFYFFCHFPTIQDIVHYILNINCVIIHSDILYDICNMFILYTTCTLLLMYTNCTTHWPCSKTS